MRLLKLLLVLLMCAAAVPAVAGPFEDGMAAYNRGDYATALRLLRPLANGGSTSAQYNIGIMYDKGQGVPQDYAAAIAWYRKAADQGHPTAQNNLGAMYNDGTGVPQDYVQAHMWFNLAASGLNAPENDKAVKNRDRVAKRMTPAQIAEAQKLAREWKPKAE
jgi:TPR repeat protein